MSIRGKLLAGFLAVVGIFALGGGFTMDQMQRVTRHSERFVGEYWPTTDLIMEIRIAVGDMAAAVLNPPAEAAAQETLIKSSLGELARLQEQVRATRLSDQDVRTITGLLEGVAQALPAPVRLHTLPGERMEAADVAVSPVLDAARNLQDAALVNELWAAVMAFNDILITGDPEEETAFGEHAANIEAHPGFSQFQRSYKEFKPAALAVFAAANEQIAARKVFLERQRQLSSALEELEERYVGTVVDPAAAKVQSQLKSALVAVVVALLLGAALATSIGFIFSGRVSRALKQVSAMFDALERGDFSQRLRLTRRDEIGNMGRGLDRFADNLQHEILTAFARLADGDFTFEAQGLIREPLAKANARMIELMGQVQVAAQQIATGSSLVSNTGQVIAQGATEQASSLEETTAAITEISTQVQLSAENAGQACRLFVVTREQAEQGDGQMQEMVRAMDEINQAGQKISRISKVIDEIAFQTNLLALNAAVEAARAGVHGKGFAVVAEEVRSLAARSATAARETTEIVGESLTRARQGAEVAGKTAEALTRIRASIGEVSTLVDEIALAADDQRQGIAEINHSLAQIELVTQSSTASAEESAAAAEELASQAAMLNDLVAQFKVSSSNVPLAQLRLGA